MSVFCYWLITGISLLFRLLKIALKNASRLLISNGPLGPILVLKFRLNDVAAAGLGSSANSVRKSHVELSVIGDN